MEVIMKILKIQALCLMLIGAVSGLSFAADFKQGYEDGKAETEKFVSRAAIEKLATLKKGLQMTLGAFSDLDETGQEYFLGKIQGYNEVAEAYDLPKVAL